MKIRYSLKKTLPNEQLHNLFVALGWSKNDEDEFKLSHFNCPFKNSTLVVSAWDKDKLVGCCRVLSDKIVRSVIHDLGVLPGYQKRGIGKHMLSICLNKYPKSEWVICAENKSVEFYLKCNFKNFEGNMLYLPSTYFKY